MPRKLKLELENLVVDSFDTEAAHGRQGTVFGDECTCPTNCTCPGCPTCEATGCDPNTCDVSCYGTCGRDWTCFTCEESCRLWQCPRDPY